MRITNSILHQKLIRNVQGTQERFARAQEEVSTGKRLLRLSDDPTSGVQVMRIGSSLRGLEQYRRNSSAARARTDAEESVLTQLSDLLSRAKELAMQEGTGTSTPATHAIAAAEVDRILEQVIQLGGTKVGSEYLFAGHQTATPPFTAAGVYTGDTGVRQAEIGPGYLITTNHTGDQLLVNSGVIAGLTALRTELASGTTQTIGATATGLDSAFDAVQTMLATTGSRSRQLDSAMETITASDQSLTIRRSDLEDVDLEKATIRFFGLQTTLQAAYSSAARLMNTNLTEYLR